LIDYSIKDFYIYDLFNRGTFKTELKQIKSKSLLKDIDAEDIGIRYSYIPKRMIRNAIASITEIEDVIYDNPIFINDMRPYLKHLAKFWESIANLEEGINKNSALLNAAITYELAGNQANSICIVKKISKKYYEITNADISNIVELFLQRLFLQVRDLALQCLIEPQLHEDKGVIDYNILRGIVSAGLLDIIDYYHNGNLKSYDEGINKIKKSIELSSGLSLVHDTILLNGVFNLLPIMYEKSIWKKIGNKIDYDRWRRYIKLLSRGLGENVYESSSISELWPSQIYAIDNDLLSGSSKIIRMPTSSGKTRIAEIMMAYSLMTYPHSKCIYVAPFKSLVWEVEKNFTFLFGDLGYTVSSITGSYESDIFEELIFNEADIIVLTPEKLDLLNRTDSEILKKVKLFVIDECQILNAGERGIKFELLLTRLKRKLENPTFLFISAVVPKETLEDFAEWFHANKETDILESDWRPADQRVAYFQWSNKKGRLKYVDVPGEDEVISEFVPGVIKEIPYRVFNRKTRRYNTVKFPAEKHKAQTAAELGLKFSKLGPVLIFSSQKNWVEAIGRAFITRFELSDLTSETLPKNLNINEEKISYKIAKEWLGEQHYLTQLLRRGVAVHTGDVPTVLRKAIESDYNIRKLGIIICTSTLAQGVNLPIRTVIMHSVSRRDEHGSHKLSARDYWNIAGRAGRAIRETEGTIIHLTNYSKDIAEFYNYVSKKNDVEPVKSVLYEIILKILSEDISEEYILEALNPEILALLIEENIESFESEKLDEIFEGTLVKIQADKKEMPLDSLKLKFSQTAERIVTDLPNAEFRSVSSKTGLSSTSCKVIQDHVLENKDSIREILTDDSYRLDDLVDFFIDLSLKINEMEPHYGFSGSYNELLKHWINGLSITEIISIYEKQIVSAEEVVKFIEDLFGYKMPWGVASIIKIATHLLEIDYSELTDNVIFLPAMIKFGVPDPASSWGMTIGIPSREVAIKLATNFYKEALDVSYSTYLSWISNIDSFYLYENFGLSSPILENVTQVINNSGINSIIKEHVSIIEVLDQEVDLRDVSRPDHKTFALRAEKGMIVTIERDYDNVVDRNAIAVKLDGHIIGYFPWQLAQLAAVDLDCGLNLSGKISSIQKEPFIKILVKLSVMD